MPEIVFLGTGGGRFVTIFQLRNTGGIYIKDSLNIHIDPGPGALVGLKKENIDPTKTDAVLVSHRHPDHFTEKPLAFPKMLGIPVGIPSHFTDAEITIEGMTNGCTKKRGMLVCSRSVGNSISDYHKSFTDMRIVGPDETITTGDVSIVSTSSFHSDPTTVGFKIKTKKGIISYISDTELQQKIVDEHRDARILILCVTRQLKSRIKWNICTEDAAEIIGKIRPELAVITHFGMKILKENPKYQAEWLQKNTGIKTIAAEDGMKIEVGEGIGIM